MTKYYLTETRLKRIIKKSIKKILGEGIQIKHTPDKNYVTFDNSNNGIQDGPVVDTFKLPNSDTLITIYSMFKRVGNSRGDGNPALYALKKENEWDFTNPTDFWVRFDELLRSFFNDHPVEVIVMLPSNNKLNGEIATHILQISPNTLILNNVIGKLTTMEVYKMASEKNSYFKKYWMNRGEDLNVVFNRLDYYFDIMDEKHNGYFSYHDIDDMMMRESLINTMKTLPESYSIYKNEINNKNVLLLDDSITLGQSVNSAVNALESCYIPKSISLLTMFSKLYKH